MKQNIESSAPPREERLHAGIAFGGTCGELRCGLCQGGTCLSAPNRSFSETYGCQFTLSLERRGRTAAFEQRMEEIASQLEQSSGTITAFDEITVRQMVSNIKVVNKDTLMICFKDGTESMQTIGG